MKERRGGQEIMRQWRFRELIDENYNNPVFNTFYGGTQVGDSNIMYAMIFNGDPNAGHVWSVTARIVIDGHTLNSAITACAEQSLSYVYVKANADELMITNVVTPMFLGGPLYARSFQLYAMQSTEPAGHGPLNLKVRFVSL